MFSPRNPSRFAMRSAANGRSPPTEKYICRSGTAAPWFGCLNSFTVGVTNFPSGRKLPPRHSHPKVSPAVYFPIHNECSYLLHIVPAAKVESPVDAYPEGLLVHAKVYHYKAIELLQAMALGHVDRALRKIDPVNSPVALVPFVEFIRYVYANTDHLDHHEEPLRSLVSNFVARNFKALRSAPAIAQLLCEGGDIVMDVMVAVSKAKSLSSHLRQQ